MRQRTILATAAVGVAALVLTGCTSEADTVSVNIATEAEKLNVQRKITGVNGITDAVAFEVEGRCSFERFDRALEVVCKHGDEDFRKHIVGLSDNTYFVVEQLEDMPVDAYRTKVVVRPETVIPDFDVETSTDIEGDG